MRNRQSYLRLASMLTSCGHVICARAAFDWTLLEFEEKLFRVVVKEYVEHGKHTIALGHSVIRVLLGSSTQIEIGRENSYDTRKKNDKDGDVVEQCVVFDQLRKEVVRR